MKTIVILLSTLILFSSCYSYKQVTIKTNKFIEKKRYKIKTNLNKRYKTIIVVKTTDSIVVYKYKGKLKYTYLSDLKKVKKRQVFYW